MQLIFGQQTKWNCTEVSELYFNNTINDDGSQADIPNYERNRNVFSTSRA